MKNENNDKTSNAGNPLYLVFIFGAIIAFIVFIPEIYEKYNKDRASLYGIGNKNETVNITKENKPISKLSDHFRKEDSINFENLTFSNIIINGNTLSIDIYNSSNGKIDLSKKHYYLELYRTENNQRSFVTRRFLKSDSILESQTSTTINVDISGITIDDLVTFAIDRVDDETIPNINLENNTLTCTKNTETYTYTFEDNQLVKTEYKITHVKEENVLNEYREKEKSFNDLNGVNSRITEDDINFTFISTFDYKIISKYKVDINYLYEANTKANIISFKTNAEGFDCK